MIFEATEVTTAYTKSSIQATLCYCCCCKQLLSLLLKYWKVPKPLRTRKAGVPSTLISKLYVPYIKIHLWQNMRIDFSLINIQFIIFDTLKPQNWSTQSVGARINKWYIPAGRRMVLCFVKNVTFGPGATLHNLDNQRFAIKIIACKFLLLNSLKPYKMGF